MKKIIFWDFDGVIIDSDEVREKGFRQVLECFPKEQVEELISFHRANGGLSRYVKFTYFFEKIRKEEITDQQLMTWAQRFSEIMRKLLIDSKLLISKTVSFIKDNQKEFVMHVVSGSDQKELRYLCSQLGIDTYFESIHGSPTPKNQLVKDLMADRDYSPEECVLIGDSVNDYEAACANKIDFVGYNNEEVECYSTFHLEI